MSRRQNRGTRSRRSCCLAFFGVGTLLVLIVAGVFAWLYQHPVSNKALDERVLRRLERISGLNVAYDHASLTLATGQYKISNIRFMDPKGDGAPLLTVEEVLATIRPWQIISNPESVLTKVVLKNPSQLDLLYSHNSIRLGEKSQFLADSVRKAQPPDSGKQGRLPFEELKIENAEMAFVEKEGILPDLGPASPAMIMEGELVVKNEGPGNLAFMFAGQAEKPSTPENADTTRTMASGVEAVVHLKGVESVKIEGKADRVALTKVFREMPGTSVRAGGLTLNLEADLGAPDHKFAGTAKAATVAYVNPENRVQVVDDNVNLTVDMDYNSSDTLGAVRSLKLESAGAMATVSGRFDGKNYEVAMQAEGLAKDYRVLLEKLLPAGWDVEATRDSLSVNMQLAGGEGGVKGINGKLSVRGANLVTPALPAALKNLHGDVDFGQNQVKLVDITGEYAGARVALDGTFDGDPWQTRTGDLKLKWSTIVPLKEVLALHGSSISTSSLSGSGNIKGNGTWTQQLNLANSEASGIPHVEGEIAFEDVGVAYAGLPAPIAGLNGVTRIKDNRLDVDNLRGSMQGNELAVSGAITGDKFFWKDAQVSASLNSKLDLAQIGRYLTPDQRKNLEKYQVRGQAETEIVLRGPVTDLGSMFTGGVRVNDVSFSPGLEFMQGSFTDVDGLVTWDGRSLRLDGVTGLLNGEEVALGGEISAKAIDLQIQAEPLLEAVKKTFPQMDKYLEMSGGLKADLNFTAGSSEEDAASMSITQMLESASAVANDAIRDKTFSLNGELIFDGASIRHIAMPPARKEAGRNIPAGRVTGMTGRVVVKNDTLTVPDGAPLNCAFSDTERCKLSGYIKLRPDNFPEMQVRIASGATMKLDTWAMGWGKDLPVPDRPPVTNKKFDLEAELIAPSVLFRGQEGGRSRAKLSFNMVQNETPRVTNFKEVVIQGSRPGMGRIVGNGRIESFVWDPQRFPRWQTSFDAQQMPLETMLTAVFITPANMRGMYSGNLAVSGIGTDANSITGQGSGYMTNLEIGGTAVIRELGQTTGRNFGGMLFQTARAATFQIGNGALSSRDLALETNGLMLEMRGDYWFAGNPSRGIAPKTISGMLQLRLFKSVFGSIPIIGQVADLADEVTNAFLLAFRVSGNASDPQISPIALPVFQGGA